MQNEVQQKPKHAIVAAVQRPNVSDAEFDSSLAELRELAKTLGFRVVHTFVQKRTGFDMTGYMGAGKRQEMRCFVSNEPLPLELAETTLAPQPFDGEIDALLVDHEISPSQARNLEIEVGVPVMDRTMVILEIFHRNARTRAARTQVEIAQLGYMAPRLREAAKLAGQQGRQRSSVGGRGVGESLTELDRRKVRDRIAELQKEIIVMDAERATQRSRRLSRQGLSGVALVGYTNAGKSTLMRAHRGIRKAIRGCWSAIRSASSRTCRTASSRRSSPPSTKRLTPRCCCM
jgi:GTP-binding protein HflX